MEAPKGIRIDSTDVNHIKVVWIWNDVHTVRIKWKVEDGNEKWKDIVNDGQEPEFEIPVPGNHAVSLPASQLCIRSATAHGWKVKKPNSRLISLPSR